MFLFTLVNPVQCFFLKDCWTINFISVKKLWPISKQSILLTKSLVSSIQNLCFEPKKEFTTKQTFEEPYVIQNSINFWCFISVLLWFMISSRRFDRSTHLGSLSDNVISDLLLHNVWDRFSEINGMWTIAKTGTQFTDKSVIYTTTV